MYLEKVNQPADIKCLKNPELKELAEEMRKALLFRLSRHGGHFGPNFGMVETIIALHYVFDSPKDKFVFDVSHQSYCHKMLTGRKDAYLYEEHFEDVSGYTNPEESEHDFFNVGHTSTSVSLACGLAKARDLIGGSENIIAVIGDGSLSGGEALEGIDFASELESNFIIVVNDNDMSIAENHGGLYKNLKQLRESGGTCECNLFRAMGLDYVYLAEGNDIEKLIKVFQEVKDTDRPIVVHINTQKGKGYSFAEQKKEDWHWCMPFDIKTGKTTMSFNGEDYGSITQEFLTKKMKKDPTVTTIVAAVPTNIGFTEEKRKEAGKQFVDVGIAEEQPSSPIPGADSAAGGQGESCLTENGSSPPTTVISLDVWEPPKWRFSWHLRPLPQRAQSLERSRFRNPSDTFSGAAERGTAALCGSSPFSYFLSAISMFSPAIRSRSSSSSRGISRYRDSSSGVTCLPRSSVSCVIESARRFNFSAIRRPVSSEPACSSSAP